MKVPLVISSKADLEKQLWTFMKEVGSNNQWMVNKSNAWIHQDNTVTMLPFPRKGGDYQLEKPFKTVAFFYDGRTVYICYHIYFLK